MFRKVAWLTYIGSLMVFSLDFIFVFVFIIWTVLLFYRLSIDKSMISMEICTSYSNNQ